MGYVEPSADFDAAVSELRQVDPRRHEVGDDVRLRAALPALDRPAAQGRPADRSLPAARARLGARRRHPRGRLRLHAPQARAGDRRPRDAARARPARRARVTLEGDDPAAALRALTERLRGLCERRRRARREPARRGARAPAGPPDDARHLRRHRRPGQAQAAAGALQPRPRGRAARALQPHRRLAHGACRTRTSASECAGGDPASSRAASPTRTCSTSCSTSVRYVPGDLRRRLGLRRRWARRSTSSTRPPASRMNRCFYLSTAPMFFPVIVEPARRAQALPTTRAPRCGVVIEKPFGTTLAEARAAQPRGAGGLRRAAGLPHRPLPGQGDRPEHDGVPVRQRAVRAAVEPQLHRSASRSPPPRTSASARAPATTTAPARCAT